MTEARAREVIGKLVKPISPVILDRIIQTARQIGTSCPNLDMILHYNGPDDWTIDLL